MSCDCSSLNFDSASGGGGANGVSAFAAGVATATGLGVSFADSNGFAFEVGSYDVGSFYLQGTYSSGGRGVPSAFAGTGEGHGTSKTIVFLDGGGVSWGMSAGVITAALVGVVQSVAAGTQVAAGDLVVFADSNGVSFGAFTTSPFDDAQGLTRITADIPSHGGLTETTRAKMFNHRAQAGFPGQTFNNALGTISLATALIPMSMAATGLGIVLAINGASSQAGSVTIGFGAYRILGPNVVTLASSASQSFSWTIGTATNASSLWGAQSGNRPHSMSLGTFSFTPGYYLLGCYLSTAGDGNNVVGVLVNDNFFLSTSPVFDVVGFDGFESSYWLDGALMNGTTAFPPRLAATSPDYQRGISYARFMPQLVLLGT